MNSVNEFNQTKQNFIRMGYKVIRKSPNSVTLEKNEFDIIIFLILLLLLVIGAIIYWAVKSGRKDEVLITLQNNNNNTVPTAAPIKELKAEMKASMNNLGKIRTASLTTEKQSNYYNEMKKYS